MSTILYNALMAMSVLAVLVMMRHKIGVVSVAIACMGLCILSVMLATLLGEDRFGVLRLWTYGIFLHGFLFLSGVALLSRKAQRKTSNLSAALALVLALVAADAFLIEPRWLEVSRVTLASPKLTRSLKIVVLADLQTDVMGNYERRVLKAMMDERPDMILLAGDYIQEDNASRRQALYQELNAAMKEAGLHAPLGAYAVKGNMDYPDWREIFAGLSVTCMDATKTIDVSDMHLTGLSQPDSRHPFARVPSTNGFHIALGHHPDFALGEIPADLLVAGHTHGGQVRLPGIGPLMTLSSVPRSWAAGVTFLPGGRTLIVSRGTGMERGYAPRLRFLCRPELVVIQLNPR